MFPVAKSEIRWFVCLLLATYYSVIFLGNGVSAFRSVQKQARSVSSKGKPECPKLKHCLACTSLKCTLCERGYLPSFVDGWGCYQEDRLNGLTNVVDSSRHFVSSASPRGILYNAFQGSNYQLPQAVKNDRRTYNEYANQEEVFRGLARVERVFMRYCILGVSDPEKHSWTHSVMEFLVFEEGSKVMSWTLGVLNDQGRTSVGMTGEITRDLFIGKKDKWATSIVYSSELIEISKPQYGRVLEFVRYLHYHPQSFWKSPEEKREAVTHHNPFFRAALGQKRYACSTIIMRVANNVLFEAPGLPGGTMTEVYLMLGRNGFSNAAFSFSSEALAVRPTTVREVYAQVSASINARQCSRHPHCLECTYSKCTLCERGYLPSFVDGWGCYQEDRLNGLTNIVDKSRNFVSAESPRGILYNAFQGSNYQLPQAVKRDRRTYNEYANQEEVFGGLARLERVFKRYCILGVSDPEKHSWTHSVMEFLVFEEGSKVMSWTLGVLNDQGRTSVGMTGELTRDLFIGKKDKWATSIVYSSELIEISKPQYGRVLEFVRYLHAHPQSFWQSPEEKREAVTHHDPFFRAALGQKRYACSTIIMRVANNVLFEAPGLPGGTMKEVYLTLGKNGFSNVAFYHQPTSPTTPSRDSDIGSQVQKIASNVTANLDRLKRQLVGNMKLRF
eukprot:TRINITY_DN5298_c0_g1_i2.p1 TRINITY_DN5298_c0_g1~~TRINITY_DN5298_c0_g1_i2.p1  ORF type:complete len:672 (-),score=25.78 TRINITY_DN5298_c0_g1_i2:85-2100(-)